MQVDVDKARVQYDEKFPCQAIKLQREAMRYAIVNGNLPATKENLSFVVDEFYLDADKLSPKAIASLLKKARANREDWEYDENIEDDTVKERGNYLKGVWIKDGEIKDLDIHVTRTSKMTDRYQTEAKIPLEEIL